MNLQPEKSLSSNLEDYLEAIFHLQREKRVARAKDIAEALQVSRASVTGALKALAQRRLINYNPYSFITLTEEGEAVATEIVRRHETLKDFFENFLLLSPERAEANACRVEHAMDAESMDRLIRFLEFARDCPRGGLEWLKHFNRFCREGMNQSRCRDCLEDCLGRLDR